MRSAFCTPTEIRFYSFSGLHRFKQKYEPNWSDRYIAYKKGVRGFTRTVTALNVAMKPRRFHDTIEHKNRSN